MKAKLKVTAGTTKCKYCLRPILPSKGKSNNETPECHTECHQAFLQQLDSLQDYHGKLIRKHDVQILQ